MTSKQTKGPSRKGADREGPGRRHNALRDAATFRRRALSLIERSRNAEPATARDLQMLATEYDHLADEIEKFEGIDHQPD